MKVWVEVCCQDREYCDQVYIHAVEPKEYVEYRERWKDANLNFRLTACEEGVGLIFGYEVLPKPYLMEFDLSGKRPKLVCVWEPCTQ
jgi:hypothetical protein